MNQHPNHTLDCAHPERHLSLPATVGLLLVDRRVGTR
jgi:hypothetical protein